MTFTNEQIDTYAGLMLSLRYEQTNGAERDWSDTAILMARQLRDEQALRQTCARCQYWNDGSDGMRADCVFVAEGGPHIIDMPEDGTGYCHRFQAKEPR